MRDPDMAPFHLAFFTVILAVTAFKVFAGPSVNKKHVWSLTLCAIIWVISLVTQLTGTYGSLDATKGLLAGAVALTGLAGWLVFEALTKDDEPIDEADVFEEETDPEDIPENRRW